MISKTSFKKVAAIYASYAIERRKLFAASDEMLAKAKQAIFAVHRDDIAEAERLLREVETSEKSFAPVFKQHPDIAGEGPHRAALEEYSEAVQFLAFVKNAPLCEVKNLELDSDAVLGGLTDCVGEIARKCVEWATKGEFKKIDKALETSREVVSALMGLNLTGYLRTKLDQAKGALRRIEDVAYDVAMRELRNKK
jgi:predicted translin family RNA/ssDNA-binding protein